jgi:high-affinity iron transporter
MKMIITLRRVNMNFQAFLITFREVLEALIIVGIITTYLQKIGKSQYKKWVWSGVAGAVVSSFLVALIFQVVLTSFAAMSSQHYMRISIMLISSVLLTQMVLWMADNSAEIAGKTQDKIDKLITAGSIFGMVIHAYLVVLREGVETVFFFAAITGGDISKAIQSQGALYGLICASVVGWLMFKTTVKIPLKTFFRVTGIFIMMIAAGLLTQGIGAMQDYGMIGTLKEDVYNIAHILPEHPVDEEHLRREGIEPLISGQVGIFLMAMFGYSHHPSLEEVIAYIGYYVVVILWTRYRKRKIELKDASIPAA